jgi:hypothetical protein
MGTYDVTILWGQVVRVLAPNEEEAITLAREQARPPAEVTPELYVDRVVMRPRRKLDAA